jgi:hypothetical protein
VNKESTGRRQKAHIRRKLYNLLDRMGKVWKAALDSCIAILGWNVLVLLLLFGVMCSLSGLLALASESRVLYHRASRFIGLLLFLFGILLPFRGPVYKLGTPLCIGWTLILFHAVRKGEFSQGITAIFLNLIFWTVNAYYEHSLVQILADYTVFLIIPSVFTLVYLSRGFDLLGENPNTGGPVIPLQKLIAHAGALLVMLLPPETASF